MKEEKKARRTLLMYVVISIVTLWALAWLVSCERDPVEPDTVVPNPVDPAAVSMFKTHPQLEGSWMRINEIADAYVHLWTFTNLGMLGESSYKPGSLVESVYDTTTYRKGIETYALYYNFRSQEVKPLSSDVLSIQAIDSTIIKFSYFDERNPVKAKRVELPLNSESLRLIDYGILKDRTFATIDLDYIIEHDTSYLAELDTNYFRYLKVHYFDFHEGISAAKYEHQRHPYNMLIMYQHRRPANHLQRLDGFELGYYINFIMDSCKVEFSENLTITKYTFAGHTFGVGSSLDIQFNYFPETKVIKNVYYKINNNLYHYGNKCFQMKFDEIEYPNWNLDSIEIVKFGLYD